MWQKIVNDCFNKEFNIKCFYNTPQYFFENINYKIASKLSGKQSIMGDVYIGPDCEIGDYVVIKGPVYIGAGSIIDSHAYIRPYTYLENNCCVGHASELKKVRMMSGSKVASFVFLGDSILGEGARIGSGVITANRRFDQGKIIVKYKDEKINTGCDKFGIIMGDYSRLGASCTTIPGLVIGGSTYVAGGVNLKKSVGKNSFCKSNEDIRVNKVNGTVAK